MNENQVAAEIVDAALNVHSELGPGLLESVYETAMAFELVQRELAVRRQKPIPVVYAGEKLEDGFRADLLVEQKVLVEIKSVEALADIHFKQVLTYLRLSGLRLGILINFNSTSLKGAIRRIVNGLPD